MSWKCRYHESMKGTCVRIPFCVAVCILLSIGIVDGIAETDDDVQSAASAKKETPIMIEAMRAGESRDTIHLFSFDQIPDSVEVRESLIDSWFSAPLEKVMQREAETYTDSKGNTFTVSGKYAEDEKDCYAISIVPVLTRYRPVERGLVSPGTWILYRNAETGAPLFIKVHPRENSALSIRLHPALKKAHSGKSFIDICLFNAYVCRDISLGLPFERLYAVSLERLRELTKAVIPWYLFDPPPYSPVKAMAKIVENHSYRLVQIKDGCFDHDGNPVHISDLQAQTEFEITAALNMRQIRSEVIGGIDAAGFAKWIIDGMVRPVAGQGTIIQSLKLSTSVPKTHFTKPYLETRNIFFGLDWIRNLGSAALSLNLKRTVYPADSGLDVTSCPFALTEAAPLPLKESAEMESAQPAFLGYQPHAGYQTSYIIPLLYYLTVAEPGHFYLACINSDTEDASVRVYDKVAVFLPYFDNWGEFHLDIYEGNEPISPNDFIEKYKDTYTAIIRVWAPEEGLFNP